MTDTAVKTGRQRSILVALIGFLIAAAVIFLINRVATPSSPPPVPKLGRIWKSGHPQSAAEAIDFSRTQALAAESVAKAQANDLSGWQDAASHWIALARITGNSDDFARAESALHKSFALAPAGFGPNHVRASFELGLHRLDRAQIALDAIAAYAVPDPPETRADQVAMRGDIAFFRGDMAAARARYDEVGRLATGPQAPCRIAQVEWRSGAVESARQNYAICETSVGNRTPQFAAFMAVQRGLIALDTGDWAGAQREFTAAETIFPGDWKIGLRIAQMKAAAGEVRGAATSMESLFKTSNAPEVADALANLYRLEGNAALSRSFARTALLVWERRVAQYPEAYQGHARDHHLRFGSPIAALRYAAADARNRPYGEPLIGLARAWIANGRADYALALLTKVDATGWKTPDTERVRAEALALAGRGDEAQAARGAALAMDPRAYDAARAYIWLDH
jgi:tetratricopeptide (TPR) repeat protein